ncbi:extracellular matrix regulator RemB [Alteribacter natronophilus]|uniref:extracellular matrix regulator RemB n=1 Tax=Alteribacter natronophilus TaxID=2583810 RepID=UPI00110D5E6D|nr:extracellular matrix/biofilm biosynthesis regulator RemA family protein [Alteribacter natronophilus]TMW71995.1 DUF370 domain-containing protein [Alteribacter natronophilus]
MFIHLGGDTVIRSKDVVAILDHQSRGMSQDNQEFLSENSSRKKVTEISADTIKSVVVTEEQIYLSPISSLTLKRRANATVDLEEEDTGGQTGVE